MEATFLKFVFHEIAIEVDHLSFPSVLENPNTH